MKMKDMETFSISKNKIEILVIYELIYIYDRICYTMIKRYGKQKLQTEHRVQLNPKLLNGSVHSANSAHDAVGLC